MSTQEQAHSSAILSELWPLRHPKRWLVLIIVFAILLIMAFYTVTDISHLHDSTTLDGADWAGYALCHRITSRSFMINGRQFPLCARCSGMYLGVILALIVLALAGRLRRADIPSFPIVLVLLGFVAVMGFDGLNSYSHFFPNAPHLYEPRNWLRLLTGMGTGLTMGIIIIPALASTLWRTPEFKPVLQSGRELLEMILLALLVVFLLLSNQAPLMFVLVLASVAGLLFIVTAINTVILLAVLRRDRQAEHWRETAVPLLIGLLLAIIQLSIISALRLSYTGTMTGFPGLS